MIIINSIGEIFEQIEVCLQEFWILIIFQFFFVLKIMENFHVLARVFCCY